MMSADVPVIVDATPPIITNYSRDQCEADALEAGLEPNALYDQVHELSGVRMSERTLDGMLLAHGVDPRTLTNKTDKARVLCGVVVPPGTPLSRSHSGGASPKTPPAGFAAPVPRNATFVEAPLPPPMLGSATSSAYLGGLSTRALMAYADGAEPAARALPPTVNEEDDNASTTGSIASTTNASTTLTTTGGAAAASGTDPTPCETSNLRRRVSHLTAAVQPLLAPLATAAASSMGGSAASMAVAQGAAVVGAAGVAAVGGYTSSVTTHEHHTQSQEMSRRLQKVAMEQDRRHHREAQGLSTQLQREAMMQEARQHRQALWREDKQMRHTLEHDQRLHEDALRVDHRLHFEGILATLREQDREADHDLWEQRTERFQMLMTVSSLLIAGGFALVVEGQLPTDPGCWDLFGSGKTNCSEPGRVAMIEVAAVHYVLLASGLGFLLGCVMGCLALTGRFAEFMDLRVQKQQLLNKDLRRAAVKMIGDVEHRSITEDRETIRKFEKVLRQQYVIETCDASSAQRHVWNFQDWFTQRCQVLARLVEFSFRMGLFSMLSAIMTFQYAHLERGDAEVSVQSSAAWQGFAWTLGMLIVLAITVPQIVGSSWSFRLRQDGFYGCKSRRGGVGGDSNCGGGDSRCDSCWCWICRCASRCFRQVTAKHRPVRFDIHNIAAQAEELFNQIDIDGNGSLSEKELKAAAKKAREKADEKRQEAIRCTPEVRRRQLSANSNGSSGRPLDGLVENSLPRSPHENELRRRYKEEEAAATAVLETIIRRLASRAEQKRADGLFIGRSASPAPARRPPSRMDNSEAGGGGRDTPDSIGQSPSGAPSDNGSTHQGMRRGLSRILHGGRKLSRPVTKSIKAVTNRKEYEVTKEEWDEAISDALF